MSRRGGRMWDATYGIYEHDPIPGNAEFDLFRFLAVCWLRLKIARLATEMFHSRWLVDRR